MPMRGICGSSPGPCALISTVSTDSPPRYGMLSPASVSTSTGSEDQRNGWPAISALSSHTRLTSAPEG